MTAVTANQLLTAKCPGRKIAGKAAASQNLYANTLAFGASGYASGDDGGGANAFLGVVVDQKDNSSGSAGDLDVELYTDGVFYLNGTSFTQGTVGSAIYAVDNYTVQTSATSASRIGTCVEYVSATEIGVLITPQVDIDTDT